MKKKLMCVLLAVAFIFTLAGCTVNGKKPNPGGDPNDPNRPDAKKIVIFCGGSSEYSVVKGAEEDKVITAIEEAYYKDSGILLDFDVAYLGSNMQSKLATTLAARDQVDIAISHTRYDSGIDDYALGQNIYYDLGDLIDMYGSNIYDKTDLSIMTTFGQEVIGIPSNVNPYKYGILVRKDYMKKTGYTDDAAEAAADSSLTLLTTVEQFTDMCVKMKSKSVTGLKTDSAYTISGAIWDLEKVFTGAFGDAGYFTYQEVKDGAGNVTSLVPGFGTAAYQDLLQLEYDWVKKHEVLSANTNSITLEASEGDFIAGKTGVFVTDPTVTHLIKVARQAKIQNPNAEFTVIGPLARAATPEKKGFVRASSGYKAAIVMRESKMATDIVKFLNWMYSDPANYNLCKYGVEGEHWVNNGDGTYSFPAGKDEYLVKAPYSGIISLVDNEAMSNMLYSGYSEEERAWIQMAQKEENYVKNDVIDYILPRNAGMSLLHTQSLNNYFNSIAVPAWSGSSDPSGLVIDDNGQSVSKAIYFMRQYLDMDRDYIAWLSQQYILMKQSRV